MFRKPAAALAAACTLVGACSDQTSPVLAPEGANGPNLAVASAAKVAGVSIMLGKAGMRVGETAQAKATVVDASKNVLTGRTVVWSSTDTTVVKVSTAGIVTAVGAGQARVQAESEGKSARAVVDVAGSATTAPATPSAAATTVASITVTLGATATVGQTAQARATGLDAAKKEVALRTVTWASSNPAVATVNASGLVTAVAAGTATIAATAEGKTGSGTLTVTRPTSAAAPAPAPSFSVVEPALPRELDIPTDAVITGKTFRPADAAALRDALAAAVPGDLILLKPAVQYVGYFRLPAKAQQTGGFVTIRTDLTAGEIPAAGTRVTPSMATRFAKIVAQGRNDPAIHSEPGSRGYRFVAVEITAHDSIKTLGTIVRFGDGMALTDAMTPSDMILDRVYVHGSPSLTTTRCVFLNSARSAVVNSSIHECHAKGWDSNAIGIVTSPGPLRIENNSVSGAGMGIFSGGSDPRVANLSPSDIVIRRNHVWRPTSWKGVWTVKNLLELKHAKRVLVENNLFENNWVDGQSGTAIVFKSTNQSGLAPWSQTADVTFRYNVVRNSPNGIALAAKPEANPAVPAARFKFEGNLFYEIGQYAGTTGGRMMVLSGPLSDVQFLNNSLLHNKTATHAAISDASPALGQARNFVARGNVTTLGTSGWMSSGAGAGEKSLQSMWGSAWEFSGNVVVGAPDARFPYPASTAVVATLDVDGLTAAVTTAITTQRASGSAGSAAASALMAASGRSTAVGADIARLATMVVTAIVGR